MSETSPHELEQAISIIESQTALLDRYDENERALHTKIEALEAEHQRLREALQEIVNTPPLKLTQYSPVEWWHRLVEDMCDQARTALQEARNDTA